MFCSAALRAGANSIRPGPRAKDKRGPDQNVPRRICVANSDAEALREVQEPLCWSREMALHVHQRGETIDAVPTIPDGSTIETTDGECFGSVPTIVGHLEELRALGIRKVIAWFHFGNMPHASVRRSMQLMASEVIPAVSS